MKTTRRSTPSAGPASPRQATPRAVESPRADSGIGNLDIARHVRSGGSVAGLRSAPADNQQQASHASGDASSGGAPLDGPTRERFEQWFGADLSSVRTHED